MDANQTRCHNNNQTRCYNHNVYLSITWINKQKEIKVVINGIEERFFNTSAEALQFMEDIRPQNARERFN